MPKQIPIARLALVICATAILGLATTSYDVSGVSHSNDKINHIFAFFTLALLLDLSFPNYPALAVGKISALIIYGLLIECIQYFLPYRSFSTLDLLADTSACLLYGLSSQLWRKQTWRKLL